MEREESFGKMLAKAICVAVIILLISILYHPQPNFPTTRAPEVIEMGPATPVEEVCIEYKNVTKDEGGNKAKVYVGLKQILFMSDNGTITTKNYTLFNTIQDFPTQNWFIKQKIKKTLIIEVYVINEPDRQRDPVYLYAGNDLFYIEDGVFLRFNETRGDILINNQPLLREGRTFFEVRFTLQKTVEECIRKEVKKNE